MFLTRVASFYWLRCRWVFVSRVSAWWCGWPDSTRGYGLGLFLGLLFSRVILFIVSFFISKNYSFYSIHLSLIKEELWLFPIALSIGLIASLIPIIQAYRINIPKTLSNV